MKSRTGPGDWIEGPFWQEAVQVVSIQTFTDHDLVTGEISDLGLRLLMGWQELRQLALRHIEGMIARCPPLADGQFQLWGFILARSGSTTNLPCRR